jgi:hypothetical protein
MAADILGFDGSIPFLSSPHDIVEWARTPVISDDRYRAVPRSVVVLFASLEPERRP